MYQVFYIFRVPTQHAQRFTEICCAASIIYRRHGAVDSTISRITDTAAHHGCQALVDIVTPNPNEDLFIGIETFESADQFRSITPAIDSDPEITELFAAFTQIVTLKTAIRWEASGNHHV